MNYQDLMVETRISNISVNQEEKKVKPEKQMSKIHSTLLVQHFGILKELRENCSRFEKNVETE